MDRIASSRTRYFTNRIDDLLYVFFQLHSKLLLSIFLSQFSDEVENIRKNYYADSNILVTQAYAVAMAGVLLPEFKNASTWLEEGANKVEYSSTRTVQ